MVARRADLTGPSFGHILGVMVGVANVVMPTLVMAMVMAMVTAMVMAMVMVTVVTAMAVVVGWCSLRAAAFFGLVSLLLLLLPAEVQTHCRRVPSSR